MKHLWFKRIYVTSILSGEKTSTYRKKVKLDIGEEVGFSVGPRKPFAVGRIVAITPIPSKEFKEHGGEIYVGDGDGWRVDFKVERVTGFDLGVKKGEKKTGR